MKEKGAAGERGAISKRVQRRGATGIPSNKSRKKTGKSSGKAQFSGRNIGRVLRGTGCSDRIIWAVKGWGRHGNGGDTRTRGQFRFYGDGLGRNKDSHKLRWLNRNAANLVRR